MAALVDGAVVNPALVMQVYQAAHGALLHVNTLVFRRKGGGGSWCPVAIMAVARKDLKPRFSEGFVDRAACALCSLGDRAGGAADDDTPVVFGCYDHGFRGVIAPDHITSTEGPRWFWNATQITDAAAVNGIGIRGGNGRGTTAGGGHD
jgi:hypothetical protein